MFKRAHKGLCTKEQYQGGFRLSREMKSATKYATNNNSAVLKQIYLTCIILIMQIHTLGKNDT